jgi:iron complex transport system substrate-binding protein
MLRLRPWRAFALMVISIIIGSSQWSYAAPTRIVSINPCLDQILIEVADPKQISALSYYSLDHRSSLITERAKYFPSTYGSAEEVMALKPDLVLASTYSSKSTLRTLKKLNANLALFALPNSIEISAQQVTRIAELVGHPERGIALNQRINEALAKAKIQSLNPPISALVYQANGFVPGEKTLINQVMNHSGFTNQASAYGIKYWGIVHLEDLLHSPPKVLFTPTTQNEVGSWSSRIVTHPVFTKLPTNIMRESPFPEALMSCAGPTLIPLAEALSAARKSKQVPE